MTKRDPNKKPRREFRDRNETLETRFMNRVQKTDSCWVWRGSRGQRGYGIITHKNERSLAHRLSYRLFIGELPDELVVCHRCDNPPCVNPEHLFIGTHMDNVQDMNSKGRQRGGSLLGETHPMHILTDGEVSLIKSELANYRWGDCQRLANRYGVAKCTISAIKKGRLWKHIP